MANKRRSKLVEKHGTSIVVSKKWCLRGMGLLLITYALAAFVLPLPIIRLPWVFALGVVSVIVAEFTDD